MCHSIGAAMPLPTPIVDSAFESHPVVRDQHKVLDIKNMESYLMKPDPIGTESSRRHRALRLNSVEISMANLSDKRKSNKVSDSRCFRSADSKTNISIISAPNHQDTPSFLTVRHQSKFTSKENVCNRISTLV